MLRAMVKVAWLATLMDDHCSSFDEDGGWMLCTRKMYIYRAFHFTSLKVE
jgi:hypothetical protein